MAYLEPLDPPDRPCIPYRRIKRHSGRGLASALAVMIMVTCAGGLWVAHKFGTRDGNSDVPLLHADGDPVKVKPDNPGGMEIPNHDRSYVYDQRTGAQPAEHLMPLPEAPLPRPTPSAQAAPVAPATPPPSSTGQLSGGLPPVAPAAAAAEPAPAAPPAEPAAPEATGGVVSSPAVAAPVHPPQTASLPPGSGKGYRLQIAAVKTSEAAKEEWDRIRRQNGDLLGALGFISERVDLGDRGIFYRIQAGPIADPQEGERICTLLRQRNVGCILVKP
jgi:cell division septation protein DedD